MRTRLGAALLSALVTIVSMLATATPAVAGPREDYEASVGKPPRVRTYAGHLGHAWRGTPTYVSGTAAVSAGELIVQDRPFDDTGADTVPGNGEVVGTGLDAATLPLCGVGTTYRYGDFSYPQEPGLGANAADLVEVRVAADADHYFFLFQLETLIDPARTVVAALVHDTDGEVSAPALAAWPGYEHVVQVTAAGATVDGAPVASHVDAAANTFEARVPRAALPAGPWEVTAAAGLWNGSAWSAVVDLGWVPDEEIVGVPNCWQDRRQSRLLADRSFPGVAVDPARLRAGATDPPVLHRGTQTRVYPPALDLGEGTVTQARYGQSAARVYRGSFQPYTVYVPDSYDPSRPNPMIVLLHCLTCNHTIFTWAAWPGLKDLAEARGAPLVTPLAYGEGGHYEGEAEVDVFEVLADARARYNVDGDRIYLTGMSMGALGTYRLGLLYPDLWARALGVGNYTNPFCVTPSQKNRAGCLATPINYFDILGNARSLPYGVLNGVLDELTPVTGAREIADRFAELGHPYRYWEYPTQPHDPDLHGTTTDATNPWFGDARRIGNPARVTYSVVREMDRDSAPFGIVHDRAYWLRDIRMADGVARFDVDATSGRGTVVTTAPWTGSGTSAAGPWTGRGLDPSYTTVDEGNTLDLTVRGVTSLTVDGPAAGLRGEEPLRLVVDSDGPVAVRVKGVDATVQSGPGTATYEVSPDGSVRRVDEGGRSLPATGWAADATPGLLVLVAALAARRLRRP